MTDIKRLVEYFGDQLEELNQAEFPTKLGNFPTPEIAQLTDINNISHISQFPTAKLDILDLNLEIRSGDAENDLDGCVARVKYTSSVGNVGNVGKVQKALTKTEVYHFPLEESYVGNGGKSSGPAGAPNPAPAASAATPPSDWWDGPAMAEVDALLAPAPPLKTPLPISPAQVRAGVERELRDLASHGRAGPGALSDAIAITRANIRNSPLLVEAQTGAGRCLVCEEAEVADRRFISVLTGAPGRMHWIHLECHAEHSRRLAAKVDAIMLAAGFGEEQQRGRCGAVDMTRKGMTNEH